MYMDKFIHVILYEGKNLCKSLKSYQGILTLLKIGMNEHQESGRDLICIISANVKFALSVLILKDNK